MHFEKQQNPTISIAVSILNAKLINVYRDLYK